MAYDLIQLIALLGTGDEVAARCVIAKVLVDAINEELTTDRIPPEELWRPTDGHLPTPRIFNPRHCRDLVRQFGEDGLVTLRCLPRYWSFSRDVRRDEFYLEFDCDPGGAPFLRSRHKNKFDDDYAIRLDDVRCSREEAIKLLRLATDPADDPAPAPAEASEESPRPAALTQPAEPVTGTKGRRGRRQYDFWPEVENYIFDLLVLHGPPSPDDPQLPNQTALEELVADFMQRHGWSAEESTIREHVVGMLEFWGTLGR